MPLLVATLSPKTPHLETRYCQSFQGLIASDMRAVMKLKTLQGHLQDLRGFSEPKVQLEQYETPAHIAAVALYTIQVTK